MKARRWNGKGGNAIWKRAMRVPCPECHAKARHYCVWDAHEWNLSPNVHPERVRATREAEARA